MKISFVTAAFAIIVLTLSPDALAESPASSPAMSQSVRSPGNDTCGLHLGGDKLFHDFDKIVIFYTDFPHPDLQDGLGYPVPLRFENFNAKLTEAVTRNFSGCKTASGAQKPIQVIEPVMRWSDYVRKAPDAEKTRLNQQREQDTAEASNPNNLTILVSLQFHAGQGQPQAATAYGYYSWDMHRPGVPGLESLPLMPNRSGTVVLFPDQVKAFGDAIRDIGQRIRPLGQPDPNDPHPNIYIMKPNEVK